MQAIEAFEDMVKRCPTRGIAPDLFLKKLESFDKSNPEYLLKDIDSDWQIFRAGWNAREREREQEHCMWQQLITR